MKPFTLISAYFIIAFFNYGNSNNSNISANPKTVNHLTWNLINCDSSEILWSWQNCLNVIRNHKAVSDAKDGCNFLHYVASCTKEMKQKVQQCGTNQLDKTLNFDFSEFFYAVSYSLCKNNMGDMKRLYSPAACGQLILRSFVNKIENSVTMEYFIPVKAFDTKEFICSKLSGIDSKGSGCNDKVLMRSVQFLQDNIMKCHLPYTLRRKEFSLLTDEQNDEFFLQFTLKPTEATTKTTVTMTTKIPTTIATTETTAAMTTRIPTTIATTKTTAAMTTRIPTTIPTTITAKTTTSPSMTTAMSTAMMTTLISTTSPATSTAAITPITTRTETTTVAMAAETTTTITTSETATSPTRTAYKTSSPAATTVINSTTVLPSTTVTITTPAPITSTTTVTSNEISTATYIIGAVALSDKVAKTQATIAFKATAPSQNISTSYQVQKLHTEASVSNPLSTSTNSEGVNTSISQYSTSNFKANTSPVSVKSKIVRKFYRPAEATSSTAISIVSTESSSISSRTGSSYQKNFISILSNNETDVIKPLPSGKEVKNASALLPNYILQPSISTVSTLTSPKNSVKEAKLQLNVQQPMKMQNPNARNFKETTAELEGTFEKSTDSKMITTPEVTTTVAKAKSKPTKSIKRIKVIRPKPKRPRYPSRPYSVSVISKSKNMTQPSKNFPRYYSARQTYKNMNRTSIDLGITEEEIEREDDNENIISELKAQIGDYGINIDDDLDDEISLEAKPDTTTTVISSATTTGKLRSGNVFQKKTVGPVRKNEKKLDSRKMVQEKKPERSNEIEGGKEGTEGRNQVSEAVTLHSTTLTMKKSKPELSDRRFQTRLSTTSPSGKSSESFSWLLALFLVMIVLIQQISYTICF